MANQNKLDVAYLQMARTLSSLSVAVRRKVGCLIVKDTQIISEGYNGTPRGFDNGCEYVDHVDHMYTKPEVLHAESNAITKLARSTNSSDGATLYVTCSPCFDCAKLIIQSGIERVVYEELYNKKDSVDSTLLLTKAGVVVDQVEKIAKTS